MVGAPIVQPDCVLEGREQPAVSQGQCVAPGNLRSVPAIRFRLALGFDPGIVNPHVFLSGEQFYVFGMHEDILAA